MADEVQVTGSPGKTAEGDKPNQFGLTAAIALIVGSIIGVGIFNLPSSLAAYGPITLVSMALTTVGWRSHYFLRRFRGACRPTAARTPTPGSRSATGSAS